MMKNLSRALAGGATAKTIGLERQKYLANARIVAARLKDMGVRAVGENRGESVEQNRQAGAFPETDRPDMPAIEDRRGVSCGSTGGVGSARDGKRFVFGAVSFQTTEGELTEGHIQHQMLASLSWRGHDDWIIADG